MVLSCLSLLRTVESICIEGAEEETIKINSGFSHIKRFSLEIVMGALDCIKTRDNKCRKRSDDDAICQLGVQQRSMLPQRYFERCAWARSHRLVLKKVGTQTLLQRNNMQITL